jgi:hypothetical protein
MGRSCSTNAYRVFVEKPEGMWSLGELKRRWGDNIKMDLRETEWGDMDLNDLAQDRGQ